MSKTWLITGAGRGFGREFALAALRRGDRVAATARDPKALTDLADEFGDRFAPFTLDVTDRTQAHAVVEAAAQTWGHLDVVVNNAGYGLFGAVEEISEQQLRDQLEVNLFGVLHVTQAALPILRAQSHGHIVQISTVGGIAAFPNLGGYHASKWAVEGLTESLAQEVAPFGIAVTLIEPGPFGTDWAGASSVHATPQPQYDALRAASAEQGKNMPPTMIGRPEAAAEALLTVVDSEQPPLRVLFGTMPTMIIPSIYEGRLKTWEEWTSVSVAANGH